MRRGQVERFTTSDIDETNRHPAPGWTHVVYRLGEGPFRFESVRVDLGDGVVVEHTRFLGATRVMGTLADDAVHVLFPYGRDLRLSGVPVSQRLVVLSPPAVQFEGSTQVEACGHSIVARGQVCSALLGADAPTCRLLSPARTAVVVSETPTAEALRQLLEGYFAALDRREDLALDPQRIKRAREDMLELLRLMLLAGVATRDDEVKAPHPRRRALAITIEEWLWRQLDDPGAPPVTLAAASRELEVSIRSIQLAVEEYFGINFVRFARLARLHQVHSALVLGLVTNVSEAATRHGFWHLGRFSRYYREVFGERPSQTVRGGGLQPATTTAVRRRLMRRTLDALRMGA